MPWAWCFMLFGKVTTYMPCVYAEATGKLLSALCDADIKGLLYLFKECGCRDWRAGEGG